MNLFKSHIIQSSNDKLNSQNGQYMKKKREIKHSCTQISKKEQFLLKLEDNQNMQQDLKNLERSVDLFIRDQDRIKYDFNKIIMDIQNLCENANLSLSGAPFINITFALWRKQFYHKLENRLKFYEYKKQQYWKKQFCQQVDYKILNIFINKMIEPYKKLILQNKFKLPKSVEAEKKFQVFQKSHLFQQFTEVLTQWCIEIETVQDIIERAELYGFYESPVSNKEFGKMLKQSYQINPQLPYQQNPKNYQEWKQKFSYLCQHKTDFYKQATLLVTNKLKGKFQSKGLTWSTGLTMFYGIMSGNPISLTAVILAGIGSTVVGKFLGLISDFMEKDYSSKELSIIIETFQETTKKIHKQNQKCQELLLLSFEEEGTDQEKNKEYQLQLKKLLDELVNEDCDQIFDDKGNQVIKTNKLNGDWIEADFTDVKEIQLNDDIIVITDEEELELYESNQSLLNEKKKKSCLDNLFPKVEIKKDNQCKNLQKNNNLLQNSDKNKDKDRNISRDQGQSKIQETINKEKNNCLAKKQLLIDTIGQETSVLENKNEKEHKQILNENQDQINKVQKYGKSLQLQDSENKKENNEQECQNSIDNQSLLTESKLNPLRQLTKFPSKFESSIIQESDQEEENDSEICSFDNDLGKYFKQNQQNQKKSQSEESKKQQNEKEDENFLSNQNSFYSQNSQQNQDNIEFFEPTDQTQKREENCDILKQQENQKDKNSSTINDKDKATQKQMNNSKINKQSQDDCKEQKHISQIQGKQNKKNKKNKK